MESVRAVVTSVGPNGAPTFESVADLPAAAYGAGGVLRCAVWGTPDGECVVGEAGSEPVRGPEFPAAGGTRFFVVSLPPGFSGAVHTTDTLDYGVVLRGEIILDLGAGHQELLRAGTCVVQRGTPHAWRNDGIEPAVAAFVVIGARRE
jgi:quercetin dioxygenase-like cupin family protein